MSNKKSKVAVNRRKEQLKNAARDKKMNRLRNIERNRKDRFASIQQKQMTRRVEIQQAIDAGGEDVFLDAETVQPIPSEAQPE